MWATLPLTTSIWGMVHTIHYWVYHILTGLKNDDSRLSPKRPCLCRRTFYRPTNWGRVGRGGVGWGVIAFVTTARHDVMLRYAFVTTARHDVRRRYAFVTTARHDVRRRYAWGGVGWGGVGWGVIAFVTTARHDVMLRYAFVTTARHDVRRRYAWGGVGWGVIAFVTTASPRQTQWFVVQIHSKSPMEMGTHWLRLADRHWQSCKISHAVKRKGHFDRSPGFEAQNPVRVANHSKMGVFFWWLFATWNRAGATAQQFF